MRFDTSTSPFFMETSYGARVYADSLRDNFVGYAPTDQARYDSLREAFELQLQESRPHLATLLEIETALMRIMPDDAVAARFWSLDDRFRRVVPLATRDRYDASVPGRGDTIWKKYNFLRLQSGTLLDVIHSNYLLNIGREKSIKRLKTIMAIFAVLIAIALSIAFASAGTTLFAKGLILLAGAGIFGSFLSITNRLQSAITVDAMTQDGIYELSGLRIGWVGILSSFVLGGGFALALYGIVMAGMLSALDPTDTAVRDAPKPGDTPAATNTTKTDASDQSKTTNTNADNAANAQQKPSAANTKGAAASSQKQPGGSPSPEPTKDSKDCPTIPNENCPINFNEPAKIGADIANAHGLAGGASFFRMLILAFLAGFAERFVPDILNRLAKQGTRAS